MQENSSVTEDEQRELVDKVFDQLVKWLREGSDTAKNPVDWPWEVEIEEGEDFKVARAFHPNAMLELQVAADYPNGLIRLVLDPLYPTKFLNNDERLKLYYSLLRMNAEAGLVKAALVGDDDGVVFVADLDPKSLGKAEFNDAIEQLYLAAGAFVKAVGWEDEVSKIFMEAVASLLLDKIEKGASREEIIGYLTMKLKLSREEAERIADALFAEVKGQEGRVQMTL